MFSGSSMSKVESSTNKKRGTILVLEPREIAKEAISILRNAGYQVVIDDNSIHKDDVIGIFIRTHTIVDKKLIISFPNLKAIIRAGVGLDNIDINACQKKGIRIYNSPGSNSESVAEYILCMSIYMSRGIENQRSRIENGQWRDLNISSENISTKTFGLIGCGNVGSAIARKLKSFEAVCKGYDPYVSKKDMALMGVEKEELNEVLSNSDILIIMLPLTDETRGLLDKNMLGITKRGSSIINVSRGEIIDEIAAINLLKKGHFNWLIFDVLASEPNVSPSLVGIKNLIITPHIAGHSNLSSMEMATQAAKNYLTGRSI